MTRTHAFAAGLIATLAAPALAQPFAIDWHTIDAGGGVSTGGSFELSGTIGQHDAGGAMFSDSHVLVGGFWAGVGSGGCNAADLALPFGSLDFSDVVVFLSAFGAMDPAADLAPPFGAFDFSDVVAFLAAFGEGCP